MEPFDAEQYVAAMFQTVAEQTRDRAAVAAEHGRDELAAALRAGADRLELSDDGDSHS